MSAWKLLSLAIIAATSLTMCTSCATGPSPEAVALQIAQSLPLPVGSTLIATKSDLDQGSQDECYAGYVESLYGTNMPIEEVVGLFREYANSNEWTVDKDYSTKIRLSASKEGGERRFFGVHPLILRSSSTIVYPTTLNFEVIDKAFSNFSTVYLVTTAYAPPEVVRGCR